MGWTTCRPRCVLEFANSACSLYHLADGERDCRRRVVGRGVSKEVNGWRFTAKIKGLGDNIRREVVANKIEDIEIGIEIGNHRSWCCSVKCAPYNGEMAAW